MTSKNTKLSTVVKNYRPRQRLGLDDFAKFAEDQLTNYAIIDLEAPTFPLVLHGDGVRDDTAALTAVLGGHPAVYPDGDKVGCVISFKRFLISETIVIPSNCNKTFTNNCFLRHENFKGWCLEFNRSNNVDLMFSNNQVI